ncbi:MAG: ABC transporter ATP-binding protein [Tissierella sp.]|nr:ABC transporter ATP-binding protein [Tissierella sp.]
MKYGVKNINKSYGDLKILEDINIEFDEYKTTCILGESGAGKTTLLNILAGITEKDSGEVVGFQDKDFSFVFQEDRLIKWKNVRDNIRFILSDKIDKEKIDNTIDEYLKLVKLEDYKHYYPRELSEGMRQRISILRAFIYPSNILIMDEPFKSLDINNKQNVIELFKKFSDIQNKTCILVTHDIDEALSLGDKIVIFSNKPTKVKMIIENKAILDNACDDKRREIREIIENLLM